MHRLSEQAADLLRNLQDRPGLLARLLRDDDASVEVVRKLGQMGEIAVLPYFTSFVIGSDVLARTTQRAIAQILEAPSAEDLLELDEELRRSFGWWHWEHWRGFKASQLSRMEVAASDAHAVFGMLSFHPSGHVREAAVKKLDRLTDGREIPYLLIRLNDWVAAVRKASRRSVLRKLQTNDVSGFFQNLHLVLRLADCGRDDHSVVVDVVIEELAAPEASESLVVALTSSSRFVRRRVYSAAMPRTGEHRKRVVEIALRSRDGVLRLWATRDAEKELPDEQLRTELAILESDRFMPVRRESLQCLMSRFPDEAPEALRTALFDRSRSVRDYCRFYLKKIGSLDFADLYRASLDRHEHLLAAIAGLGETGTPEDAQKLLPHLSDGRPRVRCLAVRAVGSLAGNRHVPQLIEALQDDSSKVTREAKHCLFDLADPVGPGELMGIFRVEKRQHVRLAIVDLIHAGETWSSVPLLIEAAAANDDRVASRAQHSLLRNVNRVFTAPSTEQRNDIHNALNQYGSQLGTRFLNALTPWLNSRI